MEGPEWSLGRIKAGSRCSLCFRTLESLLLKWNGTVSWAVDAIPNTTNTTATGAEIPLGLTEKLDKQTYRKIHRCIHT